MAPKTYPKQEKRDLRTPPHISLKALRSVSGKRLDDICDLVNEALGFPNPPFTRGALSAIEGGHRGASKRILTALEVAYGLGPGDLTTDYEPRARLQESA